jgi:integrase
VKTDVDRGDYRALPPVTFAEYAPKWLATYGGRTKRAIGQDTLDDYRRTLSLDENGEPLLDKAGNRKGAVGHFRRKRLAEIGVGDLREYAAHVAARGVARDTVRLALAPVKALLATAHEEGLIRHNPAAGVRNLLPPLPHDEDEGEEVKAMTEEELACVLAELPEQVGKLRPRLFHRFLAETSLRFGEAIEARWLDLDLGEGWLHVPRRYYRGRVKLPKGRKKRHVRPTEGMTRAL